MNIDFLPADVIGEIIYFLTVKDLKNLSLASPCIFYTIQNNSRAKCIYLEKKYIHLGIDWAVENGHLEAIEWFHQNRSELFTEKVMDHAAANGHLEVVKWLHDNRNEGCTSGAMNWAAGNGHLVVVKYLHDNRQEGCTHRAIPWAASFGNLDVVKFLEENKKK